MPTTLFLVGLLCGAAITSMLVICLFSWIGSRKRKDQTDFNERTIALMQERNEQERETQSKLAVIALHLESLAETYRNR